MSDSTTNMETDFEQWLAARAPASIVLPTQHGRTPRVRTDHDRLAALATEILAAAIKMAALLEAAQQARSRRSGVANHAEGSDHV